MARAVLDRSIEYEETLANAVRLVVPRIADYAAISVADGDGSMTWGYAAHCDSARRALLGRLREYRPAIVIERVSALGFARRGEPALIDPVDDEILRCVARDENHLALLRSLGVTSIIAVELMIRDRHIGFVLLATIRRSRRRYSEADVKTAKDVGRRVARAVDRALQLRKAQQAARSRDEVMALVSHDLRNPLHTIRLAVDQLLTVATPEVDVPPSLRQHLEIISRSAIRMERLIRDLLDVAAIRAGRLAVELAPLPAAAVVDEALELLRPLALEKGITLFHDVPHALPPIRADQARLLQVFSNLGGNAIRFTSKGGRVEIIVRRGQAALEFTVRDNGPGIPTEDLPRVFDPFWQKTSGGSGIGLGLAIVRAIVDAHAGGIVVTSEPGVGTAFKFTIPTAEEHS
ncbi:MAG: GAF domain-containing sensor histidine kinase [Longimicrobiales bacterium]